jgi:type II secretory pathway pseudopilin PulG
VQNQWVYAILKVMNRCLKTLQNEDGMTLLDTMIVAGILLIMIVSLASYQFQRAKETQARNTVNVYKQLQSNLKSGATQTQSIGKSEELGFDSFH